MWGRALDRSRRRPGSQRARRDGRTQDRGTSAPVLRSIPWTVLAAAVAAGLVAVVLLSAAVASARGGGQAPPARLPADFPADIRLPAGTLQGATGGAGRWSVLILAAGSAAEVQRSTESFYVAAGFSHAGNAVVSRGSERITIVAENRDHSATETNLTLGVTRSGAGRSPGPLATILSGRGRVSLARARRAGLRVRFTAPPAAASATVREYRTVGGKRHLVGSRTAAVHGGTNAVALDAAAIRRRTRPGLYALAVVLRGAGGTPGPPAQVVQRVVR